MGKKTKKSRSVENVEEKRSEFFDPMAVRWTERYSDTIGNVWHHVPDSIKQIVVTLAVFFVGISINGNWINIYVHLKTHFNSDEDHHETLNRSTFDWSNITLESLYLNNIFSFWIGSMAVSYSVYFIIGGFLHWYYYIRQRNKAEEWKIQPTKFLSPELERHEIMLGSLTLLLNATTSAFLACYIANGGYSTVYYKFLDYGWLWMIIQWPIVFIYMDYVTYWLHRIYHFPWLYKRFHKLHHKYKQPTAFSVTAIHPIESLHIQMTLVLPLFVLPTHWVTFYMIALYNYYHGIIDHSGINFKAQWWQPWQPDAIFHDNHHQYFHVNFAFNIEYWDKLHGTYRRKDRLYTEDLYYGTGKSLSEASAKEINADLAERKSENPLAYRDNKMEYELTKDELKSLKTLETSKNKKRKKKL